MIAIIDYGVGNLFSLQSSFAAIGQEAVVTRDIEEIRRADRLILPGVGAFQDAADKLRLSGMDRAVKEETAKGKPLLGICLGMQMLFERSHEYGMHKGLGLLKGEIRPIAEKIPAGLESPDGLERPEDREGFSAAEIHEGRGICLFCPFLQRGGLRRQPAGCDGIRRGPDSLRGQRQCIRLPVPSGKERRSRPADPEGLL